MGHLTVPLKLDLEFWWLCVMLVVATAVHFPVSCAWSFSDLLFLASLSTTVFYAPGGSFPPPMLFVNTAG